MKNIKHYNIDNLVKINADINILYGERSNGKSYQLKHKRAVEKFLKTGKRFILMRRFREEITTEKIEQYFTDIDIEKITNGKYNFISVYRKAIYLSNYTEEGKIVRGEKIGYAVALSTEQNYAGASYLDVEDIIFEEFMSRSVYLNEEPSKLMNFYCTVDRKRGTTKLWLCGNSISRVCPYIYEWELHEIISKQKQGTIATKEINSTDDDIVKIAVEYCESTGISSHTIGFNKKMLNDGSWESSPQPHLPKRYKEYVVIYRIGFQYQNFKFIGELLQDKEKSDNVCWYIYNYDKDFKDNIIVFTDTVRIEKRFQRDIYNITIQNDTLKNLFQTFREDIIFYSSDLCGTDFKQVIDFSIRR